MGSKIAHVDTVSLPALGRFVDDTVPGWAQPAVLSPRAQDWPDNNARQAVRIHTDDGVVGAFAPIGGIVAALIVEQLGPSLVRQEALAWRWLDDLRLAGRHQRGPHAQMAFAAVELALWDLRSRCLGRSIAELLGGAKRDRVPAYATALGFSMDHPLAPEVARWIADSGFWAQKWRLPGFARGQPPSFDSALLTSIREAIGPRARLCIDLAGGWDHSYARRMVPALIECQVEWIEEAAKLPSRWFNDVGISVAGGEHDVDDDDQMRTIWSGDVSVWQPDPAWSGGLVPSVRMVDMAILRGLSCFPHGTSLPTAVILAALFGRLTVPAVEYHITLEPLRQGGVHSPLVPDRGSIAVRGIPGLTDFSEPEILRKVIG